ncbi:MULTISPECIES: YbaY family lipoprotein [unclassified Streptomyces]|uniref:YbaY family lipoprotein n=1 Tax=unclassified Streptomyces TaxID=2593676 RepID=UPI000DC77A38|nr:MULTISPECIES: YbaY family lipoprotein [unclassified Streptomyces]AWZ04240.1 hypothetical protein DRB89_05900 [Streptomyces sp. ICC4]AWZ11850.1 hypothetical protein DRB96_05435 [Streptomyces sp. ICC1]
MSYAVTGTVTMPADAPTTRAARVVVEVRSTSRSDAPSTVTGSQSQTDLELTPGASVPFRVDVDDLDPGETYGIRVHVDLNGSGIVEAGDLITTRTTAVSAQQTQGIVAEVSRV